MKRILTYLAILAMIITLTTSSTFIVFLDIPQTTISDFYVGVTFSSETVTEAKMLIDKVKSYTNLFVVNSGPVSKNETVLNEICNYAVDAGLDILVYFGIFDRPWHQQWLATAKQIWGDQFIGIYYYDEPAGIHLDVGQFPPNYIPKDYDEAAEIFVNTFRRARGLRSVKQNNLPAFTSDYLLYWFDYLGGYDVMLAQFGWNHSRIQDIALVRGAATAQNKSWGVIVTHTYKDVPYLDSGQKLYDDLLIAYEAGAKYIVVFNYPKINDYGILQKEHFDALKKFWNIIHISPKTLYGGEKAEAVLVLPRNYGWGMRHPADSIWGWWGPDQNSPQIWNILRNLLTHYETRLDIVYEDSNFTIDDRYTQIYLWNSTL